MKKICSAAALAVMTPGLASAITFGQVDNFQDTTLQGWTIGSGVHPAPPQNISTGGPAGAGDRYMFLTAIGGNSAGSRLTVYNPVQWAGNYTAAGITWITMHFKNETADPLSMRLYIEGATAGNNAVTNDVVVLSATGPWVFAQFRVDAANLTATSGTAAATLSNVRQLRLMHNPDPTFPPPPIVGTLGVDNIRAVPEPATLAVVGLAVLAIRRRR